MTVQWNGDQVLARESAALSVGLLKAAEYILSEANRVVPHEYGDLQRSGVAQAHGNQAAVSYNTPYAVKQHEDLTLRHNAGRTAKYLEVPANREAEKAFMIVAADLRRALGG